MANNIVVRAAVGDFQVQKDDATINSSASIINFEDTGVSSVSVINEGGGKVTVSVNTPDPTIIVQQDDSTIVSALAELNFEGNVSVIDEGSGKATVTIPIPIFGTEFQVAEDATVSTTTSTTFQNKLTLTTTSVPAGTYRVAFHYGWNHDATSNDFEAQYVEDTVAIGEIHKQEPQDSGGTFGTTGTSQRYVASKVFYRTLTAGVHTYDLEFRTDSGGTESSIWDAIIEFWRVS